MATIFEGFGHLRSLLNQPTLTDADAKRLMTYVGIAYRTDTERYKQEWLPYIAGFARHFGDDFATLTSLDDLIQACDMLPFARWRLHIDDQDFGDDDALKLSEMPELGAVSSLWLYWVWIKAQGARALAKAPQLSGVRHLRFGGEFLNDQSLCNMLRSPYLGGVESLELWAPDVYHDDWVGALAESSCVNVVRTLLLGVSWWGNGPALLSRPNIFQRLEVLDLSGVVMTHDDIVGLVELPWFNRVRRLELTSNTLNADFMRGFCQREAKSALETLTLIEGDMTDEGMVYFGQSHAFKCLKCLDVSSNEIGPDGVHALVESPSFANLESLDFHWNPIGDRGVMALVQASRQSSLKTLSLTYCELTDVAALALAQDARFESLERVDLSGNSISAYGLAALDASTTFTAKVDMR